MNNNQLYTKSGKTISKIGIGTWTIKKENIQDEIKALQYYFNSGINYIDVVLAYDNGNTIDVIKNFLKTINREDIFINAFITYGCKKLEDIQFQINTYLEKLNTTYLDCVTLHSPVAIEFDFESYVKEITKLQKSNKFLNIGFSNLSPEQFNKIKYNCDYFEGLFNLECKVNEDNNIIKDCLQNNIPFYSYQPLRRNRTSKQNYKELASLSKKYNKTQNQILINWIVKHKKLGALIKSSNILHIKENIEALNFDIDQEDYLILDNFRNKEFDNLTVTYTNEEGKIRIDQIPNQPIGNL